MIKQDYLIRMIQEIFAAIANILLRRKNIPQTEWNEYEGIARQILGIDLSQLQTMQVQDIILQYQEEGNTEKMELAAMMLLKIANDNDSNLLLKSKLRQDGLALLQYVQTHGTTYSLQREMLIQFLQTMS